jgi:hypothetical protein
MCIYAEVGAGQHYPVYPNCYSPCKKGLWIQWNYVIKMVNPKDPDCLTKVFSCGNSIGGKFDSSGAFVLSFVYYGSGEAKSTTWDPDGCCHPYEFGDEKWQIEAVPMMSGSYKVQLWVVSQAGCADCAGCPEGYQANWCMVDEVDIEIPEYTPQDFVAF